MTTDTISPQGTEVYTPAFLIESCLTQLNASAAINRIVSVRGLVTGIRLYDGYGYAVLEQDGHRLQLYFPSGKNNWRLLVGVTAGRCYTVTGQLSLYCRDMQAFLQLVPLRIDGASATSGGAADGRDADVARFLQQKASRGHHSVSDAVALAVAEERRIRVALVQPMTGTAERDMLKGLEHVVTRFAVTPFACSFRSPGAIASELRAADTGDFDLVVLSRGGGEGLEHLDHPDVLEALARMDRPVIVAVGHEQDRLMASLLADKYCALPLQAGTFLRDVYCARHEHLLMKARYEDLRRHMAGIRSQTPVPQAPSFYGLRFTSLPLVRYVLYGLLLLGALQLLSWLL